MKEGRAVREEEERKEEARGNEERGETCLLWSPVLRSGEWVDPGGSVCLSKLGPSPNPM